MRAREQRANVRDSGEPVPVREGLALQLLERSGRERTHEPALAVHRGGQRELALRERAIGDQRAVDFLEVGVLAVHPE